MDCRRFLVTTLAGALAAPLAVEAQQAVKVYRIGMLFAAAQTDEARNRHRRTRGL
jgi:hypothetical protein